MRICIKHLHLAVSAAAVLAIINAVTTEGSKIMAAIDELETEVSENADAIASATQLLKNIKAALDEAIASGSMKKVKELADQLSDQTDQLAAAVVENTPAEGEPIP